MLSPDANSLGILPCLDDELEPEDLEAEFQPDLVPTLDDLAPVATYPDWTRDKTRVISCRIASNLYLKDEWFPTRDIARNTIAARHGRILEAYYVPGRAFFRVFKEQP